MGWFTRGFLGLAAALIASMALAGSLAPYQNSDLAGAGPYWNAVSGQGVVAPCCAGPRHVPVPVRSAEDYFTYDSGYGPTVQGSGAAYGVPPSYGRPSFVGPSNSPDAYFEPDRAGRDGADLGYRETTTTYIIDEPVRQDRYGPPRQGCRDCSCRDQSSFHVRSYGGAEQHYGAPRCQSAGAPSCGCGRDQTGNRSPGEITLGQGFNYADGGVGPIPDSGYVGGGGGGGMTVIQGGGSSASASASAYASSSSSVSINYGGGGRGHGGGRHGGGGHGGGGCNSCGGGH